MSVFKKTLLYLGLGPDEEYEFGQGFEPEQDGPEAGLGGPVSPAAPAPSGPTVRAVPMTSVDDQDHRGGSLSGSAGQSGFATAPSDAESVRRIAPVAQPARVSGSPAVRALPIQKAAKPSTIAPVSFNDAQAVADRFTDSQAVIVNLQNVDRDLSRRIIDFASGLCYGLGGQMERVAKDVYLLTPDDVEITDADRQGMLE